jgi:hypothetical protein
MANHQAPPEQLAAQTGEQEFLTVNMVTPATGGTVQDGTCFARLLLRLAALALEHFGAGSDSQCQDAPPPKSVLPCLVKVPVDPFDGQLLCFRQADTGYQLHSAGYHATATQVGERDLGFEVTDSTLL